MPAFGRVGGGAVFSARLHDQHLVVVESDAKVAPDTALERGVKVMGVARFHALRDHAGMEIAPHHERLTHGQRVGYPAPVAAAVDQPLAVNLRVSGAEGVEIGVGRAFHFRQIGPTFSFFAELA